jgi:hypothetical protein
MTTQTKMWLAQPYDNNGVGWLKVNGDPAGYQYVPIVDADPTRRWMIGGSLCGHLPGIHWHRTMRAAKAAAEKHRIDRAQKARAELLTLSHLSPIA